MKTKIICISAFFALLAAPCFANDLIEALDTDKDQLVSTEEAKILPELFNQFDKLDTNQDGKIDSTEIMAFEKTE